MFFLPPLFSVSPRSRKAQLRRGLGFRDEALMLWGCPKIRGTFVGVSMLRIKVFGGLRRGPPIFGNYHMAYWE